MKSRHVALGLVFGFVLVRAGATRYDAILGMFTLTDLHLMGVIGVAVLVAGLGFRLMKRAKLRAWNGEPIAISPKPMKPGILVGGLIFGAGWAIAGTCPGTALAQIGEGRLAAIATFAGILVGAWLKREAPAKRAEERPAKRATPAPEPEPAAPAPEPAAPAPEPGARLQGTA